MRHLPWPRLLGFGLLCSGLLLVPVDLLLPESAVSACAVAGAVAAVVGAPLVLRREDDSPVATPVPVSPFDARERERILFLAIHDVRRMIQTMRSDEVLVAQIDRRLAKGVADAGAAAQRMAYPS